MLITFLPSRVTIWWFMHHRTSGQSLLMDQMYITYAEGMTEEKLKCITGGKHHRSSFVPRAGRFNSSLKKIISKVIKYLKGNYFGHRARFPPKYWDYRNLALTEKFQFRPIPLKI